MAFGMANNTQQSNTGIVRKKEMEIACECWFTSKGKMQPLMFKYQDEQGEIHTIKEIQVLSRRKKSYGVPVYRIWRDNKLSGNLYGSEADFL